MEHEEYEEHTQEQHADEAPEGEKKNGGDSLRLLSFDKSFDSLNDLILDPEII